MQLNQQNQPEGAEIKIPGVGSTPIAISKQLPAAVAQLSQKGETKIFQNLFSLLTKNQQTRDKKNLQKTKFLFIFDTNNE